MRTCIVLALAWLLAGCATTTVVRVACLPMRSYSPAEQEAAAVALAALPENSPLVALITDYGAMREADRACMAANR